MRHLHLQWEQDFVGVYDMKKFALGLAVALALPVAANAAVFTNGSFETGPAAGQFATLGNGSTAISNWVVGGNSIDYIGTYWQNQDGDRSIDLSGGNAGSIAQTFDTVANQIYNVSFWLSGNPAGAPTIKTVLVDVGGAATPFTFDTTGISLGAMGWVQKTFSFTAAGTSTTLTFASDNATAYGPALDNVSVVAVPEPATWALMIGGLALAGAQMRRRKSVVSFA